ncbi:MAG: MCE family protein [Saprospiraceae bacterium]|nr:MCE family protein [Saprospiraceae bacterium]
MQKHTANSVKLGVFVLTGIFLLVLTLYILGKNKGMFGASFDLKTHFRAVNGLVKGNNVRFSGIDIGSVKNIVFVNDTVIEVTMSIERKMKSIIRSNAVASLGTDGLIGNRVVNIAPARGEAPLIKEGDLLPSKDEINTDEMLQTLRRTNDNVAVIAEELRSTIHRINTSAQLTELLEDRTMSANLKASFAHLHEATEKASALMTDASATLTLASQGKGTLATILTDTTLSQEIRQVVQKIKQVEESADRLANDLNQVVVSVDKDYNTGQGTVNALMKDSLMAAQLRQTIDNVEKGTEAFSQNMEALKHNFLFKRYFKKIEKEEKKKAVQKKPQ